MKATVCMLILAFAGSHGFCTDFPVADFGATGDGKADDGPAIQKAVDAAVAAGAGSRVVFDKKSYRLDWCNNTLYQISLAGGKDISIEGNTVEGVGGSAVYMTNETGSFYEGPVPQNCIIRNNVFRNTQGAPIVVGSKRASGPGAYAKNIRITGNRIEGHSAPLIQAFSVSGLNISGNRLSLNPAAPADTPPLSLTNIVNETISDPVLTGPVSGGSKPPNFILILADDLGYGDLGITGSKQIPTPHIDSLAANGVRFTNAYVSSSVCAPSRAGLMTGKHPASFGFRDNLAPVQPGHDPEFVGLPLNQTTLAQRLRQLGYSTGLVGKWHLGELPKFNPLKRGFDEFWGYLGGAHDYFKAQPGGEKSMAGPILCNYKEAAPLTYLTDNQGDECADFIRRHKDRPFFLYASFAAPHSPMQATEEDLKRFAKIDDKLRRTYCAMVYRLDQNVGKILAELRAQGIERETFVVFLSDNGGPSAPGLANGSLNAPFRGSKTTVLEGGIRVPMIFKWPATLPSGTTVNEMVSSLDIVPSFIGAAGGLIDKSEKLAGVDLLPYLAKQQTIVPHQSLMWSYTVGSAIRTGDWKLIRLPDRLPMLYHLSADPGEQNDLALGQLDRTRSMLGELGRWEVRSPNPVFREPDDWRVRHLKYYDGDYQISQPESPGSD